jgi:hypothetical protein
MFRGAAAVRLAFENVDEFEYCPTADEIVAMGGTLVDASFRLWKARKRQHSRPPLSSHRPKNGLRGAP